MTRQEAADLALEILRSVPGILIGCIFHDPGTDGWKVDVRDGTAVYAVTSPDHWQRIRNWYEVRRALS